jgi:hypothetical protein
MGNISSLREIDFLENLKTVRDSNYLIYSEDFSNNVWGNYLGTKKLSATSIYDPFNQTYVKSISGTSSIWQDTEYHKPQNSLGQYTFSIYVHSSSKSTGITPTIWFVDTNNRGIAAASVQFDPKNGKFVEKAGALKDKIDNYGSEFVGNGWYRYFLTTTQTSAIELKIRTEIYYNTGSPAANPWPNNIIPYGAQLQKGNPSFKYLKTTTTPKVSLTEQGFVQLKNLEPSLGLPYIENEIASSNDFTLQGFPNYWFRTNCNIQKTNNIYSPISTFDVCKFTPTTTNGIHRIGSGVLPELNTPYTFSVYLREDKTDPTAYRYARLIMTQMAAPSPALSATINLDDGSLVSFAGDGHIPLSSYSITPSFSGWYRLSITGIFPDVSATRMRIDCGQFATTNFVFSGDGSKHIYIWGAQAEKGVVASNLVETLSGVKSDVSYTDSIWSSTNPNSAYYFLMAAGDNNSYENSRRFTGNDTLFLSGKNLSYKTQNPKFNFDVNGNFHSLSAYFNTLSTNSFSGSSTTFKNFEKIEFNQEVIGNKNWYINYLSADQLFVTSLCSTSTLQIDISVPSICANNVFSSISWNVTAGGYISARNIRLKGNLITPFVSANNTFINNLTSEYFLINRNLTSLSTISAQYIHGTIEFDPLYFYYNSDKLLTTRLSSVYFLGVKPSDSFSTDNISLVRSITGSWDGSNGSIIETYPVLKPYFKNIKQVFDYVHNQNLYGEELNILIYEDISQNNVNKDSTFSNSGCVFSGNIDVRYITDANVPLFLKNAGFGAGDYVWSANNNSETTGKIQYWNIDRLNFANLNIYGMYDIGSLVNFDTKKMFTVKKPFDSKPRKITFRTYVLSNTGLTVGNFGSSVDDWKLMNYDPKGTISYRPVQFDNDEMDVNIHNICFEFDTNANDATCLYFKSGRSYLSNITVAALGTANYAYGSILAWPQSTVYVCGETQIDPYLLNPSRWNNLWTALDGAENQSYFPGYGLAIVGNPTTQPTPTFFSNAFIQAWRSRIFFMDFQVNRRIGRYAYHNCSIILDGKFSANAFYELKDHAKIYSTNHVFKTSNFYLSNLNCSYFSNLTYPYINTFSSDNRDNFYYLNFKESFSTFIPHYLDINKWEFKDSEDLTKISINSIAQFTTKLINTQNPKYIFDTTTKTIDLSAMIYDKYQKNSLFEAMPMNDNRYLYEYKDPNELSIFNTVGLYNLPSPVSSPTVSFNLSYYN